MKKKYILLAGATGYLGRFIASELHEQDYSETIHKAMSDRNPKDKYLIGPGAKKMSFLRRFPAKTRDKMLAKAIYK
jgi:nucleoside-diphosphate-sugar epimerase